MGHNIYGDIGDFFNEKAAEYKGAADQASSLGLDRQAKILADKSAHCCELFSAYRATYNSQSERR